MVNFKERIEQLYAKLSPCTLCPHRCGVNRRAAADGRCRSGNDAAISSYNLHFGEEPPLSGFGGSGTIFFTRCTLRCVFCQNYPISQLGNGNPVGISELTGIMLSLQERGAHNINLVTPTHFTPQIVEAVAAARRKGLRVPLVYNCGGYEDVETLRLLEGIIDIYLPDAKYADDAVSLKYSGAPRYWDVNRAALKEMFRQVGNLVFDREGIAARGLLIRHLLLPNGLAGSRAVLEFIAEEISPDVYLSLMAQYHPAHLTDRFPELSRRVTPKEYREVLKVTDKLGLENGWKQEL